MVAWRTRAVLVNIVIASTVAAACGGGGGSGPARGNSSTEPVIGGTAPDTGAVAWPAPLADQVGALATAAGLQLEPRESLVHHVHAHLDVFIDGEHRTVPAGIGIVISDPGVHVGTVDGQATYGGIQGCDQPCISPLHTHDITGIIHTESPTSEDNTLGQLFAEWNVRFDDSCVGDFCAPETTITIYVDGHSIPLRGATTIPLTDQSEIAVIIGRPPARIPDSADFSQA